MTLDPFKLFTVMWILCYISCGEDAVLPPSTEPPSISIDKDSSNPCYPSLTVTIDQDYNISGINDILWTGPDNFSSNQVSIDAKKPGTYKVEVAGSDGMSAADSILILDTEILSEPPAVQIENLGFNTTLELILAVTTDNATISSYAWSNMLTTDTITIDSVGTYSVVVTDECGLSSSTEIEVTEMDLSPYLGSWNALDVDVSGTLYDNAAGSSLLYKITSSDLNYILDLNPSQWTTSGVYTLNIELMGGSNSSITTETMGSGMYQIIDDMLISEESFFEDSQGMMSTSEAFELSLSFNDDGYLVMSFIRIGNETDESYIEVSGTYIWERL